MGFLLFISFLPLIALLAYPAVSFLASRLSCKPVRKSAGFAEPVSILIACYNEENYIARKINSFLHPDEWIEGSEIIVVSAGSTDRSNEILDGFSNDSRICILKSDEQITKITAVNMAVDHARHSILVFSDCRQEMKRGSVKKMLENFYDPQVGTVVSVLEDPDKRKRQSFFRGMLNRLIYFDSLYASGLNIYGALYAQRRSVFRKFPQALLFDDLFAVVSTLAQRKRLVQEPHAVIYDLKFEHYYKGERLERLTRGLLIFLFREWKMLMKIPKAVLLRFLVFKYVKLLLPFSAMIWAGCLVYYLLLHADTLEMILVAVLLLFPMLFKPSRGFMLFTMRMLFYFFSAIFKFFVLKQQSVRWAKLRN